MENKESVLLNNTFGWGGQSFGLMGTLLMTLFDPTFINQHPFIETNEKEFLEKFENASTQEEKDELINSNVSDYWKRVLDKIKNPDPEAEQRLDDSLKDINEQLNKLSKQKQSIVDDWVME